MAGRNTAIEIPLSSIGNFPEHWKTSTLNDACSLVTDGTHDSPKVARHGYPLVTGKCITGGRLKLEDAYSISEEDHQAVIARSKAEYGDILFANIGNSIGELARVEIQDEFSIKNVALFKPSEQVESLFLKYYLGSPFVQSFIRGNTFGSAQPFVGLGTLRGFPIPLPPLPEQKAIAHVLGSLDDKIELNRRMNETLEGMAQALFKSWFVDFDPVIDNAIAAGNPIPEPLAQRAETRRQAIANGTANRESAQDFPASFRFTEELGWIPEGWDNRSVGDCFELLGGHSFKSKDYKEDGEYGVVTIKNVQDGSFVQECSNRLSDIPEKMKGHCHLEKGNVLLSLTGNVGRICIVSDGKYLLNQRVSKIVGRNGISEAFAYFYFRQSALFEMMVTIAKGTAQANLSPIETAKLSQAMPSNEIILDCSQSLDAFFKQIISNISESQTLAKLCNVLLPKLISGELRIPQAEKMVEEAIG